MHLRLNYPKHASTAYRNLIEIYDNYFIVLHQSLLSEQKGHPADIQSALH